MRRSLSRERASIVVDLNGHTGTVPTLAASLWIRRAVDALTQDSGGFHSIVDLRLAHCHVRSWRESDAESLAAHANNRRVWLNLRDGFPHPYALADARRFIQAALAMTPETRFAIEVQTEAAGGIGFTLHDDVERVSAEIGYWLGEIFWGRGIMTEALAGVTAHAIRAHHLTRVFAVPYEWNPASFRVLEKVGYVCEGRMRRSALKDGRVIDQLLYAYTVGD